jgi:5-(carboxyamino)imidazole ribonucleotide synthase
MMAQAAPAIPVEVALLRQPGDEGADEVVDDVTTVDELSAEALEAFARRCDVVTFDHEWTDPDVVAHLDALGLTMHPGPRCYLLASDKGAQRQALAAAGLPVPDFRIITAPTDLDAMAARHGWSLVVKTCRGGYDGGGVYRVEGPDDVPWFGPGQALVEPALAIEQELAVLVVRRPGGEHVVYPVVATFQDESAICREVIAPAPVAPRLLQAAEELGVAVADEADSTGILAVELFVVDGELVVNELAARPHNTGHLSIEGCATSQFENHLRAVADLPLGPTTLRAPWVVMENALSPGTRPLQAVTPPPATFVHDYAKAPRPGRKVGHVTALGDDLDEVTARARRVTDALTGPPEEGS